MKIPSHNQPLQVKLLSATNVFYDGPANALSAHDRNGPFDVLAGHANFIALLTAGPVTIHTNRGDHTVQIDKGLIRVSNNQVTVLVNF